MSRKIGSRCIASWPKASQSPTHLLGGHTRLPLIANPSGRICELNSYRQSVVAGGARQIDTSCGLELLADHYAFEMLLLKLQRTLLVKPNSTTPLGGAWWERSTCSANSSDSTLAVAAAAAACLFLLFYSAGIEASETHPHPFSECPGYCFKRLTLLS